MKRYLIQQGVDFKPVARADTKAPLTKLQLKLKQLAKSQGKSLLTRITTREGHSTLWLPVDDKPDYVIFIRNNAEHLGYKPDPYFILPA